MKFPNDEARLAYFTEKLREKSEGPGVPQDRRISRSATTRTSWRCPTHPTTRLARIPFLEDFIKHHSKGSTKAEANREPFYTDVEKAKKDPIYNGHSYHT